MLAVLALLSSLTVVAPAAGADLDFDAGFACPAGDVPASGFEDLDDTHALNAECLAAYGIIEGTSESSFEPASQLTRGQAATLIVDLLRELHGIELPAPATDAFDDVDGTTHQEAIEILAGFDVPVLHGTSEGVFEPNGTLTRGQFAALIVRTLDRVSVLSAAVEPLPASDVAFSDTGGTTHEEAIARAAAAGIVDGFSDGSFQPGRHLTRGQGASVFAGVLGGMVHAGIAPPVQGWPDPEVAITRPEATVTVEPGDELEVVFTSDQPGDYTVEVGDLGELADGEVAPGSNGLDLTIPSDSADGTYDLTVEVTNPDGGTGSDTVTDVVEVSTPSSSPSPTPSIHNATQDIAYDADELGTAVDAAVDGDELVLSGAVDGGVTVDVANLTISGDGTIDDAGGGNTFLTVAADGVTVSDITIDGSDDVPTSWGTVGIQVMNNDATIDGVTVRDLSVVDTDGGLVYGVAAYGAEGTSLTGLSVSGSTFERLGDSSESVRGVGVVLGAGTSESVTSSVHGATVENNVFVELAAPHTDGYGGGPAAFGVNVKNVESGSSVTMSGNDFTAAGAVTVGVNMTEIDETHGTVDLTVEAGEVSDQLGAIAWRNGDTNGTDTINVAHWFVDSYSPGEFDVGYFTTQANADTEAGDSGATVTVESEGKTYVHPITK